VVFNKRRELRRYLW